MLKLLNIVLIIGGGVLLFLATLNLLPGSAVKTIVVSSGSMSPTFQVGDLAIVVSEKIYRPGQIILYQKQGLLIFHRLIKKQGNGWLTKGDANPISDQEIIQPKQIIGRSILKIPWLGRVIYLQKFLPIIIISLFIIWLINGLKHL